MRKNTKPARRTQKRRKPTAKKLRPVKDLIDEIVVEDGAVRDELIVAAILAAAHTTGKKIYPHCDRLTADSILMPGAHNFFGIGTGSATATSVCAVGAGVLYAEVPTKEHYDPIHAFAQAYGESDQFAMGVSYGFERGLNGHTDPDHRRGEYVGEAVFMALYDEEKEAPLPVLPVEDDEDEDNELDDDFFGDTY